ncbi:hypothetical protein HGM15179_019238 [Zosterops borbonicus]|uniref:Protein KRI1 homolog n=1 Tax=Zosterops borbonicus TaxID=364589 RepID=A0A8K1DB74_9PASS|nr:hypothetical protein HGM15179_019238 [Zosterops borbonicus]
MAGPKLRVNAAFAERYGRYRQREELQRRERTGNGGGNGAGNGIGNGNGGNGTGKWGREWEKWGREWEKWGREWDRYRQREELQRLRDRYGDPEDSEGSDSSESSGDNLALDPREEREFYRTLALLKSRDPRIYQKDAEFYTRGDSKEDEDDDEDDEDEDEEGDEEPPARPMFLKDYERKVVLEKEGKYVDEEYEEDEKAAAKRRKVESSRSYVEEQRELRDRLRAFVADSDEEEGEGQGGGALLKPRLQTREEKEQEQQQYLLWLRGQAEPPPEPLQDLEPLQRFWTDPGLEPGEKFLRDFLLGNGRDQEGEEEDDEGAPQDPLEDSSEEGEQFLEQQQEFERRHNFRFEEPGAAQVQTFPRLIPSSVRRRDERRKEKREQTRQRKRKERERRREELKQLKNLKRQELEERLRKIREASGGSGAAVGISGAELEEDFDPQGHDRMMAEWFGEEFYGRAEEEKPQFQEEEGLDDDWNWDSWTGREEEPPREPHCEDPDFVMDADFVPGAPPDPAAPPGRAPPEVTFGKRRRKSRFQEALEREKPPFDPASGPFERYLDEFYSLDFEDVVGDLPCRFKYRRVLPCDFGLSTDEILAADDKELNRWCSLRKTCMYR